MILKYILKGKLPIIEPDLMRWGRWFETADRVVARTELSEGLSVSTVFLGMDHGFGRATPLLFETMTFSDGRWDEVTIPNFEGECLLLQDRYSNWRDAEKGHARIVARMERWLSALTDQKTRPIWTVLATNRGDKS